MPQTEAQETFEDLTKLEMETALTENPEKKKSSGVRGILSSPASKLLRPESPGGGLQRRSSGRGSRLEVQNGAGSAHSSSPAPGRKSSRPESPAPSAEQIEMSNGKESAFSKMRDTLQIAKPKKKSKGKMAYSVDPHAGPVEIDMSKYTDPFDPQNATTENVEERKVGQGHDFKTVSVQLNKAEPCDVCGELAWGLSRQVVKCSKCDLTIHRKCESKVIGDCPISATVPAAVMADETVVAPHGDSETVSTDTTPVSNNVKTERTDTGGPAQAHVNKYMQEKISLARKIREYNRKITPVHHIHIKSSRDATTVEYQGFVRVHMCVQRPIHVSTAITRTSWYRLMRPVKEKNNSIDGFETAFYLPTDTNRLVHITNTTTTKELVQILLKKFCVTDNPKKFSLYEEYGSDCRRLFEEDFPLEVVLEANGAHRNSKLVLRDNTYHTIQWEAFSVPELSNFILMLQREEEIYATKLRERFGAWRDCVELALKECCMDDTVKRSRATSASVSKSSSNLTSSHSRQKVESVV